MPDKSDVVIAPGYQSRLFGYGIPGALVSDVAEPDEMSFAAGAEHAWETQVKPRWASLLDTPEEALPIPETVQREIYGERRIPTESSITQGEARRRAQKYDFEQQFDAAPEGWKYFLGSVGPSMLSPESLGGLVIGGVVGAPIARALTAGRGLLGASLINEGVYGVATGAGSAALETYFSKAGTGEQASISEAAAKFLAPENFLLSLIPVTAAGVRQWRAARTNMTPAQHAAGTAQQVNPEVQPPDASVQAVADTPVVAGPALHVAPRTAVPRAKLNQAAAGYEGGVGALVRDLSLNTPAAQVYLRQAFSVEPDNFAIREFLDSARGAPVVATPEARAQALRDIDAGKPPAGIPAELALAARVPEAPQAVSAARAEYRLGDKAVELQFASPVDKAFYLAGRGTAAPAAKAFLREQGFTPEQIKQATKRTRARARFSAQKAKEGVAFISAVDKLRTPASVIAARQQISRGVPPAPVVAQFSTRAFLEAVESARATGSDARSPATGPAPDSLAILAQAVSADPALRDALEQAARAGVDTKQLESVMDAMVEGMARCRLS